MKILLEEARAEIMVKNSRFLSEIVSADTPEHAREIWRLRKTQYDNGGHIVYAFIVGAQGNVQGCSDDGEPSGTAGRPTLEVLKGSGLTNVILTTARWFGGTKLGTGGLVHAYTASAQAALENIRTRELIEMKTLDFTVPYPLYEQVKRLLAAAGFETAGEEFADLIRIRGELTAAAYPGLRTKLRDLSNGRITLPEA
ncbi:MAG: YigZ family protein [Lentisphaeria bacterium]|nr:YigZ family protein [Lentisphaeria bacterium]